MITPNAMKMSSAIARDISSEKHVEMMRSIQVQCEERRMLDTRSVIVEAKKNSKMAYKVMRLSTCNCRHAFCPVQADMRGDSRAV
jgi:hypothetical protein